MPIISINDIGVKEDSAQRLIETVGIDDKYLLSADEINAIVEYCKNNVPTTSLYLGQYLTQLAFESAHPTGVEGNFAWVLDPTENFYIYVIWDVINAIWVYDYITQLTLDEIYILKNGVINANNNVLLKENTSNKDSLQTDLSSTIKFWSKKGVVDYVVNYVANVLLNFKSLIGTTTGNDTQEPIIVRNGSDTTTYSASSGILTLLVNPFRKLYKYVDRFEFQYLVNGKTLIVATPSALSDNQTQTFQDKSGVIALTSDIPATIKVLAKKGTYGTSITGTVSETILEQFTIPAGELVNGNIVDIRAHFYTSGTNPFRYRISNVNSLAGATQIAVTPNATNNWISMGRRLFVLNNGIEVYNSTYQTYDDLGIAPGSYYNRTAITIDLSLPIYVFITGALTSQYGNNKSVGYTAIKY